MPESKRPLKVFLCHASADKPKVRELYRYLRRRGINPWFDEIDLIGGQDWQVEIPKALATSDAIIICLTKSSSDKEGYIQKEIKFALDKALEMPEGRIFLIPVKFEECEVPFSLNRYQWVDLTIEAGFSKMMKALKFRASQLERLTVELPKKAAEEESLALEKTARAKAERELAEQVVREKEEDEAVAEIVLENMKREADEKASQEKRRMELEREANRRIERKLKSAQREIFFSKIRNKLNLFFIRFRAYIISALLVLIAIVGGLYLRSTFFKNIPAPTQISTSELTLTTLPSLTPTDTSVPTEIFPPIPTGTPTVPPSEFFVLDGVSVAKPSTSMAAENVSDIAQLMQWTTGSEFLGISPDSVFVAVASNQEVDVRNTQQGETVATFDIDEIHVDSIIFSNDNTLVAVGSSPGYATLDAIVQIWNLNEKRLVRTITIPKSTAALSLSISPDNSKIATGLFTGYTIVWDIQTGRDLLSLGNQFNVSSVLFSPTGASLASGGGNWIQNDPGESLIIYSIPSGQRIHTLDGKTKSVSSLASTLDGKILASGSLDGKIVLWESENGEIIRTLNIGERVNNLAFTPDGKILASGAGESVQLWQVENGVLLKTIKDMNGKVENLSFSDDGTILIIGTDNGEISAWGDSGSVSDSLPVSTSVPSPTAITDANNVSMVLVPAGNFIAGEKDKEREVSLDAFYIDKYEVTNSKYSECVSNGGCDPPAETVLATYNYYGNSQYDDYPVVWVNITMAKDYCSWRGAQLPSELEWEKAARGTDGRIYPWGNIVDDVVRANAYGSKDGYVIASPVGSFPEGVSPYGAYDMAGNVWEWRSDITSSGGSWVYGDLNVYDRYDIGGGARFDVGFRCAKDAP